MRNLKLLLCAGLSLALIGCGGDALQRAPVDPPHEVFDAVRVPDVSPGSAVKIHSVVQGEVQVVVFPGNEVALDYIPTGWGNSEDEAAFEAHDKIAVKLDAVLLAAGSKQITIDAAFADNKADPHVRDSLVLHVRVPPRVNVELDTTAALSGTLTVLGEVNNVKARTHTGDIIVRGAIGELTLTTEHGNINVDARSSAPDQINRIDAQTRGGSITLFAVGNSVNAQAVNGQVHFVGALAGKDNSFVTTGNGNLVIAVPDDVTYDFRVTGGSRVVNDFTSNTLVCGRVDGNAPQRDDRFRTSPDAIGHVDVTRLVTNTDYVAGTMIENQYYLFHTNRSEVTKYIPTVNNQPRGASTLLPNECNQIDQSQKGAIHFEAKAEKGTVYMRLIHKHDDKQ